MLLIVAADEVRRLFREYLAPLDIQSKHFVILFLLANQGAMSQVEIGQATGVARAPMVQLIDHLEQRGLAERTPNPSDRRAHAVQITEKGREVLAQANEVASRVEAEIHAHLSAEERQQLNYLLNRLLGSHFPERH